MRNEGQQGKLDTKKKTFYDLQCMIHTNTTFKHSHVQNDIIQAHSQRHI